MWKAPTSSLFVEYPCDAQVDKLDGYKKQKRDEGDGGVGDQALPGPTSAAVMKEEGGEGRGAGRPAKAEVKVEVEVTDQALLGATEAKADTDAAATPTADYLWTKHEVSLLAKLTNAMLC